MTVRTAETTYRLWTGGCGSDTVRDIDAAARRRGGTVDGVTGALRAIIFAVIGATVGFAVGVLSFRVVATLDTATGWEDLVSVALALFSFAPVGALVGALLGLRRRERSLLASMAARRRIGVLAGAAVGMTVGVVAGVVMDDPMSALFLAVWGLPVGGLVGWLVVRTFGAREEPPVVPAA